jgi:hypothetical protein
MFGSVEKYKHVYQLKLISWSRVLLEKLIATQLVKKFPAFFGTGRFITVLTRASH